MQPESYTLAIDVDGFSADGGWLALGTTTVRGGDGVYTFEGTVKRAPTTLRATVRMELAPGVSGSRHIEGPFFLTLEGSVDGDRIHLVGVGPLGVTIDLRGTRVRI